MLQLGIFNWDLGEPSFYYFDFVVGRTPFSDSNTMEIDSASPTVGRIFLKILVEYGIEVWRIIFSKFFLLGSCPRPHCNPMLKMPTIQNVAALANENHDP